jgi:hypothetical protein
MRGQTTLDFAIGISLFLAVVVFVFLFIPGLLSPFTTGAQADTVTTNRIADKVTKGMLGSPRQPYTINEHCTVTFFDGDDAPSRCSGDWASGDDVETQAGLDSTRQSLNVTVRGNVTDGGIDEEILCWDRTGEQLVNASDGACDVPLTRGGSPPQTNDASVTALRVVSLAGEDVTVYVEIW